MNSRPSSAVPSLLLAVVLAVPAAFVTAQEEEPRKIFSAAQALKLGEEKMADQIKGGEAGEDTASRLYAAAKRLETENKLAQKNIEAVLDLAYWRTILDECADGFCMVAYGYNGGGTMYSHGASRNDSSLEDFLAGFSKGLPFGAGKGDAAAAARMGKVIAFVRDLKAPEDLGEDMAKTFKEEREKLIAALENVKGFAGTIPAAAAKAAIGYVIRSASWLEYDEKGAGGDEKK